MKHQLFRTELQYVGDTIFIKDKRVSHQTITTKLEAIENLNHQSLLKVQDICKSNKCFQYVLSKFAKTS